MGKGYAEGPAADAAEARIDEIERGLEDRKPFPTRAAVYCSSADDPERHFLGWVGDVDPDELFALGLAWGIPVVRRADTGQA